MGIQLKLETDQSREAFRYIPESMNMILSRAINDITRHIQETARSKDMHRFISRTGKLERSGIDMEEARPDNLSGKVFLNEEAVVNEDGVRYARFVHEGTKAHPIRPKNKKMLKFITSKNTASYMGGAFGRFQEGMFTFAFGVSHPGTKPDRFIYAAGEKEQDYAVQVFQRAIDGLIQKYGEG